MLNNDPENDPEIAIQQISEKLFELMRQYNASGNWVPWARLAGEVMGAVHLIDLVKAYTQLPQYSHLFAQNNAVIMLSQDGLQYVNNLNPLQLTETQEIASSVVQYASGLYRTDFHVNNILQVAQVGDRFVQAISINLAEEIIPTETPVSFYSNADAPMHLGTDGKIVGQEPDGETLYISFRSRILPANLPGHIQIDNAFLLTQLAQKIDGLREIPDRFSDVLNNPPNFIRGPEDQDSLNVANLLFELPIPWSRFLWGPPGAGKTFGVASLGLQIILSDENTRVLLLAPSNKAVDVFVEQLMEQIETRNLDYLIDERKILRFGYAKSDKILNRPELLGPKELDGLNNQAKAIAGKLKEALSGNHSSSEIAKIRTELLAKQEEVKNQVFQHVQNCQIVATTVTQAYQQNSPISNSNWGTVLVDEVTMVPPAICVFLSSLAEKRFLLAGDPRQLGPVYKNNNQDEEIFEWMGRDVFSKCGISQGVHGILADDSRLVRIISQRRCAPEIWSKVKYLYPEVNNLTDSRKLRKIANLQPCSGKSIVVIDTSSANSDCRPVHGSWENKCTAEISMDIANSLIAESDNKFSVAVISPYRAQVRLLRKYIRQENCGIRMNNFTINIESGTVHQFQGSDADVVIFDMVDGPGRAGLGYLLKGDTGNRLINVAITRAKGKLIVVADKRWCINHNFQEENPILWDLLMGENADSNLRVAPGITESPIEQMLFESLHARADELSLIQPQVIICDENEQIVSRADFAFPEIKYAIYCDGRQWHLEENRWHRDLRQRNKLAELGWTFSVFSGKDIHRNIDSCVNQISNTYNRLKNS